MGRIMSQSDHQEGAIAKLSTSVAILASQAQIDILLGDSSASWLGEAEFHAVEIDEPLPLGDIRMAEIIVVESDPSVTSSMDRVQSIKARFPDASVVVAMDAADLRMVRTLVKAGVADVVALPLSAEELVQAIVAIGETRAEEGNESALGSMITVVRGLGGGGATSLITHLAAELGNGDGEHPNVCILDLDLQFGRVAQVLNLAPRRTLTDLLEAKGRVDSEFLQSVIARHPAGIAVVAAPDEIGPLESIDTAALDQVLQLVRREFEYVLIDLPSNLTNWSLSIVSRSDRVMVLTEQSIPNLRQARRRIDLFRSLGLDLRLLSVVLNRVETGLFKTIGVNDVERALGQPVAEMLHDDSPYIAQAQEQGRLVGEIRRKSKFAADIAKLAERLETGLAKEVRS